MVSFFKKLNFLKIGSELMVEKFFYDADFFVVYDFIYMKKIVFLVKKSNEGI